MLTKLALAIFIMVNGSPVGPLGVAIFDASLSRPNKHARILWPAMTARREGDGG
jgi:hypothetical protein